MFDGGVGVAGQVAQQDRADAPGEAAGGVVGQESGVAHVGGAGQERHDRAQERHEPAAEHGGSAAAGQGCAGGVDAVFAAPQHLQRQQSGAVAGADLVAEAVSDDGGEDDGDAHEGQRHVLAAGGDAAEDGGSLPR